MSSLELMFAKYLKCSCFCSPPICHPDEGSAVWPKRRNLNLFLGNWCLDFKHFNTRAILRAVNFARIALVWNSLRKKLNVSHHFVCHLLRVLSTVSGWEHRFCRKGSGRHSFDYPMPSSLDRAVLVVHTPTTRETTTIAAERNRLGSSSHFGLDGVRCFSLGLHTQQGQPFLKVLLEEKVF